MDPITRMSEDFMKAWLRFRQSKSARFFRIDTDPSMHTDLWRLFRAIEMSPDNRSPYLLFNKPFVDRKSFFQKAAEKVAEDYGLIKAGLEKDGVRIEKLQLPDACREPEELFALTIHTIWEQVKGQFEYLMIILLPERVDRRDEWIQSVDRLLALLPPVHARLAIADGQDPLLSDVCLKLNRQALSGRFFISSDSVQEYLLKMAEGGWGALSDKQNSAEEQAGAPAEATPTAGTGMSGAQSASSPSQVLPADEAKHLRVCMARAARASSEQKPIDAIEALREARTVCNRNGLSTHEALMLMAIANTFLSCQNIDESLLHYKLAADIATEASAPVVTMQARMGAASALFHIQSYDSAAETYIQAAEDALSAESEVMRIEALRMAGTCYMLQNQPDNAANCWSRVLQIGDTISRAEIEGSNFTQVGKAFAELCERRGLTEQAKSVASQVEAIKQRAAVRDTEAPEIVAAP